MVSGPPSRAHVGPRGQGARKWPPQAWTPQGVRRRRVWEPDPSGAYLSGLASGARTSLSPRKGSGATTCWLKLPGRRLLGQPCHVLTAEGLPWGASPSQKYSLPADTRGTYVDTTVSPPVSKAARRITVYWAQAVYSLLIAPCTWIMMICCRSAEACIATVRAEATARWVSAAPSPVRRILAQQ
jgi:hypothetical protein